jgi:hypothetical protein
MADPQPEHRTLFCAVLNCQTPQEQASYLDQACRGKPELRARVEALLRAHADAGSFLQETPGSTDATAAQRMPEPSGTTTARARSQEHSGAAAAGAHALAGRQAMLGR